MNMCPKPKEKEIIIQFIFQNICRDSTKGNVGVVFALFFFQHFEASNWYVEIFEASMILKFSHPEVF